MILHWIGKEKATAPIIGPVTGVVYLFNRKDVLVVDKRDAVYMLGPELDTL